MELSLGFRKDFLKISALLRPKKLRDRRRSLGQWVPGRIQSEHIPIFFKPHHLALGKALDGPAQLVLQLVYAPQFSGQIP